VSLLVELELDERPQERLRPLSSDERLVSELRVRLRLKPLQFSRGVYVWTAVLVAPVVRE